MQSDLTDFTVSSAELSDEELIDILYSWRKTKNTIAQNSDFV